jgi:predicted dehydrogenase
MSQRTGRREFLKQSVGAGLCVAGAARSVLGKSANGKIQHAAIGVGGKGWPDVRLIAAHPKVEIAAICDVDTTRMDAAAKKFPAARRYQDWRELLDREGDRIDTINVTTPDHMHAPITMTAIRKGKHVYCQKPLTHDIYEARRVTEAAAKAGVVTQMGIQVNSSIGHRMAVQMVRDGAIGKVRSAYLWSNKPSKSYRPTGPRPTGSDPVPEMLDWDAWLGTAPVRPYKKGVYHPTWWRGWQDFGVGWLGDMGCHIYDMPYQALGLTAPLRVRAEVEPEWWDTPGRRKETWPRWQVLHYTFGGTDLTAGKTIDFTWSDGGKYPPEELRKQIDGLKFPAQGSMLLGEEGTMLLPHVGGPQLFPKGKFKGYERPKVAPRDHYLHWIDACLGKGKTDTSFDYSGPLTETVLLGTVALRCPDKELAWDAARLKVTNLPAANQYLRRTYRNGWSVEGL